MTGSVDSVEPTSFARLDALALRGRRRSSSGEGPNFDALVATATSKMMSDMASGSAPAYRRPTGALGMSTPSFAAETPQINDIESPVASAATPVDQAARVSDDQVTTIDSSPAVDPAIILATESKAGEEIFQAALDQVGAAYTVDGTDPESGFDDAGLVRYAYRAVGVEMPAGSDRQATMGVPIESIATALPGDIIAFGDPIDHVAIYAGNESVVHAPSPDEAVRVEDIERPVESIRRIVTPGAGPVTEITFTPNQQEARYQPLFDLSGGEWDVSPTLLAAIAETESNFDPTAVSPAGAQGLMQFMPATAREMEVDPWDPASAVDGAARYMRTSLDQFGEPELAIASYNAGRGAVSRYGGIPPFTETQSYVRKVVDAWRSRS